MFDILICRLSVAVFYMVKTLVKKISYIVHQCKKKFDKLVYGREVMYFENRICCCFFDQNLRNFVEFQINSFAVYYQQSVPSISKFASVTASNNVRYIFLNNFSFVLSCEGSKSVILYTSRK